MNFLANPVLPCQHGNPCRIIRDSLYLFLKYETFRIQCDILYIQHISIQMLTFHEKCLICIQSEELPLKMQIPNTIKIFSYKLYQIRNICIKKQFSGYLTFNKVCFQADSTVSSFAWMLNLILNIQFLFLLQLLSLFQASGIKHFLFYFFVCFLRGT